VVGGLEEADREELRKVCKTTAAIEHAMAWLPRWIEVVPPQEEEEDEEEKEGDEDEGSKDEDEDVELDEEDEDEDAEDENEEVDAGGPPGATPVVNLVLGGIATRLEDALAAFKRFRAREPTRRLEIRLGKGAHKTGFRVMDVIGEGFPGVVGGGDFRGLNLEGGGWDGLRIKTPEVCAVYGKEGLVSVAILQGVQTIGEHAFARCSSLASVALPGALETIGESAFSGCSSLASVAFPDALRTIGMCAFFGCSSLASVAFPDALQTIGN
jgi:hypothetical protein